MARTNKSKATASGKFAPVAAMNGLMSEVLTLPEAAAYLRLSEAEVLRLIDEQELPMRQVGKELRFLKSAIQEWLARGASTVSGKAAQLAVAGSWKDDPLVDLELQEALRRRGRAISAGKP